MRHTHSDRPPLTLVPTPRSSAATPPDGQSPPETSSPPAGGPGGNRAPGRGVAEETVQTATVTDQEVDAADVVRAVQQLLTTLGIEDPAGNRCRQMAHALARMVSRAPLDLQAVANEADCNELIISKGIRFRALCQDHLLPLSGVIHLGYIPDLLLLPPAEPARVVSHFCRQPQSPQGLASQIAHWLDRQLGPRGIGVIVHAEHSCDGNLTTYEPDISITSSLLGEVRDSPLLRAHFLSLTGSP